MSIEQGVTCEVGGNMSGSAGDQLVELLTLVDASKLRVESGFVDVLGDGDPIGPRRGQQVFRRKGLPVVYERIWRPFVSRFFFGVGGPRAATERRIAFDMLAVSPGDRVIDIGCGPGNYTRHLARASGDGLTVGLDASEAMIAAAAKKGGGQNLAYVRGDACALPFEKGAFDVVCCVGVIHMVERVEVAFEELVRVLAPGGRLAIVASCARQGQPRHKRGGVTVFARDELPERLRESGLVDIDQRVVRRGQFVFARKPGETPDGR